MRKSYKPFHPTSGVPLNTTDEAMKKLLETNFDVGELEVKNFQWISEVSSLSLESELAEQARQTV